MEPEETVRKKVVEDVVKADRRLVHQMIEQEEQKDEQRPLRRKEKSWERIEVHGKNEVAEKTHDIRVRRPNVKEIGYKGENRGGQGCTKQATEKPIRRWRKDRKKEGRGQESRRASTKMPCQCGTSCLSP